MLNLARRILLLGAAAAALAGCAKPGLSPDVRTALAPTGTLRIAVYPGSPTSLLRGPGPNEMRGLTVEIGRELARRLGVPAEIVVFEKVPDIVEALKAGKADFTITNASPARAKDIDFTAAIVQLESGYLVPANSRIFTPADIDRVGVSAGVTQGSSSQSLLMRELQKATVMAAPSVMAASELLRNGELEAFATHKGILFDMSDRVPGSRVLDGRFSLEQLAVGVPKGRSGAAAYLQDFVSDANTQALVQQAALRAGLRGLAPALAR